MFLFYACSAQMGSRHTIPQSGDAGMCAVCHSIRYALPFCNFPDGPRRPRSDAPARRAPGGARPVFQRLEHGRPPEWGCDQTLDGKGEHADGVCTHRRQDVPHHGARAAAIHRTGADTRGSHAHTHHLRIRRRGCDARPHILYAGAARRSRRALASADVSRMDCRRQRRTGAPDRDLLRRRI